MDKATIVSAAAGAIALFSTLIAAFALRENRRGNGVTAVQGFDLLYPYIEGERKQRAKGLYLEFFEYLAVRIDEEEVTKLRSALGAWKWEEGRSGSSLRTEEAASQ